MSKGTSVMLRGNWPGAFRRTIRDEAGVAVLDDSGNEQVIEFQPGQVVELDAKQIEAVADDIGVALWIATEKEAKPEAKPDRDKTNKFVDDRAKAKAAKAAKAKKVEPPAPVEDAPRHRKADLEKK